MGYGRYPVPMVPVKNFLAAYNRYDAILRFDTRNFTNSPVCGSKDEWYD